MININMAKRYCKDDISKIENYEQAINDKTQTWHCHHRLELTLDGEFAHTREELIRLEMYYKRPYFELIFLANKEHAKIHGVFKRYNKSLSHHNKMVNNNPMFRKEARKKTSLRQTGKNNSNYGFKSEFGRKFFEHFGITKFSNPLLYSRERSYWVCHNKKCRWE